MLTSHLILFAVAGAAAVALTVRVARTRRLRYEWTLAAIRHRESRLDALLNNSPVSCFIKDELGRLVYRNRNYTEAAGSVNAERWFTAGFPFAVDGHRYRGGLAIDLSERESQIDALRSSEARFRKAFACAAIGMSVTTPAGRILEVNKELCRILGYEEREMLQMNALTFTHPDDRAMTAEWQKCARESLSGGIEYEKRCIRRDGSQVWVRVSIGVVRDTRNEPTHFVALLEDISRERTSEDRARLGEERWQLALEATNDGIWDWDAIHNTVYYSARWKEILGFAEWELPNAPGTWEKLVHPEDIGRARAAIEAHLARQTSNYTAEYRIRAKDGTWKWVLARGKAMFDETGRPLRMIGAHTDITERKQAEERLFYQASFDSLTGLMNRGYFLSWLDKKIATAHAKGQELSLCMCDIDLFKAINDRYGHRTGDDVLINLARILQESVRSSDISGRLGGDEFCVLLNGTNSAQATECLDRVRDRFQTIAFGIDGHGVFSATASFGVASLQPGMNSAALIEAADRALYAAKNKGRNVVAAQPDPLTGDSAGDLRLLNRPVAQPR